MRDMSKTFNVNGICYPNEHYMVNIDSKLAQIKQLVDEKKYFVINRARQYGKTTTFSQINIQYFLLVSKVLEKQLLKAKQHFVELYVNYCMIRYYMKKFLQLMIQ